MCGIRVRITLEAFVMDCVLTFLGQRLILRMMVTRTQTHFPQSWRLDGCTHAFIHLFVNTRSASTQPEGHRAAATTYYLSLNTHIHMAARSELL